MKKMTEICLMMLMLKLMAATSFASDGKDNGGKVRLCYVNSHYPAKIEKELKANRRKRVELHLHMLDKRRPPKVLDIISGTRQKGLINRSSTTIKRTTSKEIYEKLKREAFSFYQLFKPYIIDDSKWIPTDQGVLSVDDVRYDERENPNCIDIQAARYSHKDQVVKYDSRIINILDPVNLNALKVHEDIYHFYSSSIDRRNRALDSFYNLVKYTDYMKYRWKMYDREEEWFSTRQIPKRLKIYRKEANSVVQFVGLLFTARSYKTKEFVGALNKVLVLLEFDSCIQQLGYVYYYFIMNRYYAKLEGRRVKVIREKLFGNCDKIPN